MVVVEAVVAATARLLEDLREVPRLRVESLGERAAVAPVAAARREVPDVGTEELAPRWDREAPVAGQDSNTACYRAKRRAGGLDGDAPLDRYPRCAVRAAPADRFADGTLAHARSSEASAGVAAST